jgi:tetratricopeptide (TPR) repeat protein
LNRRTFIFLTTIAAIALIIIVLCCILFTCKSRETGLEQPEEQTIIEYLDKILEEILEETFQEEEEELPVLREGSLHRVSHLLHHPPSLAGLTGRHGWGVNVSEINPVNFENPDLGIMQEMGVQQYIISFLAGEQFFRNGEWDRAIAEYTVSINRNPQFINALISRGNAWMRKREYNRAIEDFNRAIRLDVNSADLYNYRGFARTQVSAIGNMSSSAALREMNLAIEDFSRAIAINQNHIDALINRSFVYYQTGNFTRVIEDCNRIITLEPSNAVIWNRRGSAWYRLEDDNRALNDFTEAIRLRNDYATALFNRANTWLNKRELDKAYDDLTRCLIINPSYSGAEALKNDIRQILNR